MHQVAGILLTAICLLVLVVGIASKLSLRHYLRQIGGKPTYWFPNMVSFFDVADGYRAARARGEKPFFVYGFIVIGLVILIFAFSSLKNIGLLK